MFNPESLGRLAVSSIIAALGFIALIQSCGLVPNVIVWWLIYCIGSGVALNSESNTPIKELALLSALPAIVPAMMAVFFVAAGIPICISLPSPWIPLMLPLFSWFGIFIFSFARTPLTHFVAALIRPETETNIKKTLSAIQLIIAGIAAIALALASLGKN